MGTTATFALAALLLGPSMAVVGGGGGIWSSEEFRVPQLRAGERFVYDAVVEGADDDVTRQAGLVTVGVGQPRFVTLADRSQTEVVPVSTKRGPAFWDDGVRADAFRALRAERHSEWFRLDDGAVVHADRFVEAFAWSEAATHEQRDYAARYDGDVGPVGGELAAWRSGSYRVGGFRGGVTIDGRPAVQTLESTETVAATARPTCAPPLPAIPYEGVAVHGASSYVVTRSAWATPGLALPLLASCTLIARGDDGADLARVTFHLQLAEHAAGQEPVRIGTGAAYVPQGLIPPEATEVPGLPADGSAAFRLELPIADAVAALRDSMAEPLESFGEGGAAEFRVFSATYQPGPWSCSTPLSGASAEASAGEACFALGGSIRTRTPRWEFQLEDATGARLRAGVVRTITNDVVVEDRVWSQPDATPSRLDPALLPTAMTPLLPVVADWLPRYAITYELWALARSAALRVEFDAGDRTPEGHYAGRITISGEGHAPLPGPRTSADHRCTEPALPDLGLGLGDGPACAAPPPSDVEPHTKTHQWAHTYGAGDGAYVARAFTNRTVSEGSPPAAPATTNGPGVPVDTLSSGAAWGVAGGAAAVSLVGLGYGLPRAPRFLRRLLALALYAHVARDRALDHPTRRDLVGVVQADPGVTTKELCRRLGIGWGTAVYHLGVLEQNGFLISHRGGRYRGWFTQGSDAATRQRAATLRSLAAQRVMRFVREKPGCTQRELARAFGVDHVAVIFHTRRLEDSGLLRKERRGRTVHYFATEAALAHAATSTP